MPIITQNEREMCAHRTFLQEVAVKVLDTRAQMDGDEPGQYDTTEDPEGHVVSILNALHHWCERYNVDWQAELRFAQHIFEDDMKKFRKWVPNG